jgi:hypothetical protein
MHLPSVGPHCKVLQAAGGAGVGDLRRCAIHRHHVCLPSPLQVNGQKKKCGFVSPRRFVGRVKAENALFSSFMHQARTRSLGFGCGPTLHRLHTMACATPRAPGCGPSGTGCATWLLAVRQSQR